MMMESDASDDANAGGLIGARVSERGAKGGGVCVCVRWRRRRRGEVVWDDVEVACTSGR